MLLLTTPTPLLAQQGGTARYVYDDNGRLVAVISPSGEANVYDYDAAGNFTAIRRLTTNDLAVLTFSPRSGLPGDVITFVGVGFGNGVSNISFNGASAQIVSSNTNTILAVVPQGATTGPVSITTSGGTVSTALPFVLKGVRVSPASPRVFPGNTIQFSALVQVGSSDPTVLWSVNAVNGGNSTVGTITQNGFYTAPAIPGTGIVVRATSVSVPTLIGEANVTILNPDDFRNVVSTGLTVRIPDNAGGIFAQTAAFSSGVTVQVPTGTQGNITQTGAFSQGVTVQLPTATSGTINQTSGYSPGLTVQLPTPIAGTISQMGPVSPGVTVQLPGSSSGTITQTGAFSLGVSASRGPVVSSISPNQRSRGTSSTVTVTGMNFQSASGVQFTLSGALDNNLSVSNFVVSGDGGSITFTLTISVNASLGQRVLIITTPQGHSPTIGTVSNMLEVIP